MVKFMSSFWRALATLHQHVRMLYVRIINYQYRILSLHKSHLSLHKLVIFAPGNNPSNQNNFNRLPGVWAFYIARNDYFCSCWVTNLTNSPYAKERNRQNGDLRSRFISESYDFIIIFGACPNHAQFFQDHVQFLNSSNVSYQRESLTSYVWRNSPVNTVKILESYWNVLELPVFTIMTMMNTDFTYNVNERELQQIY